MVAVSLDGFIEGPNGEYDWCMTDQDYGMKDFFKRVDAIFLGRKSYELTQGMESDTDWMPKMKEYIFSNTLKEVKGDGSIISGNIKKAVDQIKNEPGKDIWMFGGAALTESLMNEGLIDEFILAVHPILLGSGKLLFHGIKERIHLELINSKQYNTGLMTLHYTLKK
jgi:dihydrofolate reductase